MSKSKKIFITIACTILSLIVIFNAVSSAFALKKLYTEEDENITQEDDVVIAEQYTIKSTKNISDAYISGDYSGLDDRDLETLKMADKVIKEIIKDKMTPYEKEVAVYKWMTKNVGFNEDVMILIHDSSKDGDNPYDVLKFNSAVCVGYATTFRLFMQMLNIQCMVVHDTYKGHSWDLVKLDNDWYHVDIYSDSSSGNFSHFNITDSMMEQSWDTDFYPSANSLKYNYSYRHKIVVKSIYDLPGAVRKAVDKKPENIGILFDCKMDKESQYIVQRMLDSITGTIDEYFDEFGISYSNTAWTLDEDNKFFAILSFDESIEDDKVDETFVEDKHEELANKALADAFSDVNPEIDLDYNFYNDEDYQYNEAK